MRLDAGLEITERVVAAMDTAGWDKLALRVLDSAHPEQRDFVTDPARYLAAVVGRGGGKTTAGMFRFVIRLLRTPNANCIYLAKVRDHAKRLMWDPLKKLLKTLGFQPGRDLTYNETSLTVKFLKNGAKLRLCGADKPSDVESIRGESYHEIGIDEGAIHPDALVTGLIREIIGPRLLCSLWIIGTPGKRLKGLFYEITRRGSKLSRPWKDRADYPNWKGWSLHKWSLKSAIDATAGNPIPALVELYAIQQAEIADQQLSDENPVKRREYDGEWAADDYVNVYRYRVHISGDDAAARGVPDGSLWNQWDPERVGPYRLAKLPDGFNDWAHVIAFDLGFADPTAINVFAFSPSDPSRTIYHRYCFEKKAMHSQTIAHHLIGSDLNHERPSGLIGALGEWPNGLVADSAHQMAEAILAELSNVYGITIERAVKGFRYKLGAIDVVNGELIDGRIKVLKDSELEAQLLDLQWAESKSGEPMERKDQPNHSADCTIYARVMIANFISAGTVEAPPDPSKDPHSPDYIPPMPDAVKGEYAHLFQDDYQALLG